ncbi:dihydropteroate synthase [Mumia zhuanghuii]|uniref:Dihydropteroate synthase n=2 Tax=Mumia TaxID=1546255 RepID=A0A5Q6RIY0_9ACTN|nr:MULTISPECIES: dihydropteroate synthase [Mumia]KAA1418038.1 dihydropteroate synthase [Mumia zhuanghuii]KAA1424407.1 dihydropteroate synthase [Mumia zhuanghuii]
MFERRVVRALPDVGRCQVMGVVNVTPDSFSDGGRWLNAEDAVRRGLSLVASGADIIDVGGESTRPGAQRVDAETELARVEPVVRALSERGVVVSVDTMRAEVAERAVAAGARIINDVSGGLADPDILGVAARAGVPYVVMHWRGHSDAMQGEDATTYADLVPDVVRELSASVDAALAAGVKPDQVVVDPGIGFSKRGPQNWSILAHLAAFAELGYPLLVAASRKRFLGELLAADDGTLRDPLQREAATVAITALAATAGAWAVRVHEVPDNVDSVRVAERWRRG